MTKDELIAKLKTIVQPYIQDEQAFENLTEETDFINDLKINSANLVDVVLDVEDEFDIRIENEDMEEMLSNQAEYSDMRGIITDMIVLAGAIVNIDKNLLLSDMHSITCDIFKGNLGMSATHQWIVLHHLLKLQEGINAMIDESL